MVDPVNNNQSSVVFKITIPLPLIRLLQFLPKKYSPFVFDQYHLLLYSKSLYQLHKNPIESLEIDEVFVAHLGEVQDEVVFVSDVVQYFTAFQSFCQKSGFSSASLEMMSIGTLLS